MGYVDVGVIVFIGVVDDVGQCLVLLVGFVVYCIEVVIQVVDCVVDQIVGVFDFVV